VTVAYVKSHGAMYNDMMADHAVREAIMRAVADYHRPLALMLQATPDLERHREEAQQFGIGLLFEAFADRCYTDDGKLLSRRHPAAIHDREQMLSQVRQLNKEGTVTTLGGHRLALQADSLCVHGDNPEGVLAIREIRALVDEA
jgi:UPF0271 protein